jgi:uncharacterized protein (TIGR02996 family)
MPPTFHPGAVAFLRDIKERPDDDTPRLVYADWLDEQGDADRAEFIRVQCELERGPDDAPVSELRKRARALEKKYARRWLPPTLLAWNGKKGEQLKKWTAKEYTEWSSRPIAEWSFRRGFLDAVVLRRPLQAGLVRTAAEALDLEPLRCLTLDCHLWPVPFSEVLAELATTPHLEALRELRLMGQVTSEAVGRVASSPHLTGLHELELSRGFSYVPSASVAADVQVLVDTPLGRRLTALSLTLEAGEGPGFLRALTTPPGLPALTRLRLGRRLGEEGLARLTLSPLLANVTDLELTDYELADDDLVSGPRDMRVLVNSPLWPRLKRLSLYGVSIWDEGMGVLEEALPRSALRELSLVFCRLTKVGLSRFAAAPSWGQLESLRIVRNNLVNPVELARSPRLDQLRSLALDQLSPGLRRELGKRFGRRFQHE